MQIKKFVWETADANSYFIAEGNNGLLIDAVDSEALYKELKKTDHLTIILTHSHFDHICGLNRIREIKPNVKVIGTEQCSINIGNKYKNMSSSANVYLSFYNRSEHVKYIEPICCEPADRTFETEMYFKWCHHDILLFAVYGHSNDGLIMVLDGKYMFSGDTLLPVPTVTRFPGGNTCRFQNEDLPRLKEMKVEKVFPGHGLSGSLEEMLEINL